MATNIFRNLDFGLVDTTRKFLHSGFNAFLQSGSNLYTLSKDQVNVVITEDAPADLVPNPANLIKYGAKFFDVMAWLAIPNGDRPIVRRAKGYFSDNVPSLLDVAKMLFFCFFFLLTQARYPGVGQRSQLTQIPAFLTSVLGLPWTQRQVADAMASFPLSYFNPIWIRHIDFGVLGQEAISRFSLGMAGSRLLGPIYYAKEVPSWSPELKNAHAVVRALWGIIDSWDFHPLTRSPDLLKNFGSFNKNLNNVLIAMFTTPELQALVNAKQLYKRPEPQPGATQWKTWDIQNVPKNVKKILDSKN